MPYIKLSLFLFLMFYAGIGVCATQLDTLTTTFIGSTVGAGVVVLIDWLIKERNEKLRYFRESISIQLALNQMLNVLLELYNDYEISKKDFFLSHIETMKLELKWTQYRHILLRKFNQTYSYIELDWDLSQFLSINKSNFREDILRALIPARAGYVHINILLQHKNSYLEKAQQRLDGYMEWSDADAEKIIGTKLFIELKSITDQYYTSLLQSIKSIDSALQKIINYVHQTYPNHEPLELFLTKEQKIALEQVFQINI